MPVIVKKLSDDSLKVGNKVVYRNSDNQWIAVSELTTIETQSLSQYLEALDHEKSRNNHSV